MTKLPDLNTKRLCFIGDNSDYNHLDPVDFLTSFPSKADGITLLGGCLDLA